MKKLLIIMILISIFVTMIGCEKQSSKMEVLSNELKEKDNQIEILNARIIELEEELKLSKEPIEPSENYYKERTEKLEELSNKLPEINSLEGIIDEYLYELDGAYAEGYGYRLYELYSEEGMDKFISILSRKDISIVEGVISSLFRELSIQRNVKEIDEIIHNLEKVKLEDLDDKERYIIYSIFTEAYGAKNYMR